MQVKKICSNDVINFAKSSKKIYRLNNQKYANLSTNYHDIGLEIPSINNYEKLFIIKKPKTGFNSKVYRNSNNNKITIVYKATSNQEGVISDMQMVKDEVPL